MTSYPDTISRLESELAQLQDVRMQEARENDQMRSEVKRLRARIETLESDIRVMKQYEMKDNRRR